MEDDSEVELSGAVPPLICMLCEGTTDSESEFFVPAWCPKGCRVRSHQHAKRTGGHPYRRDYTYTMCRRLGSRRAVLSSSPGSEGGYEGGEDEQTSQSPSQAIPETPSVSHVAPGPVWMPVSQSEVFFSPGGDGDGFRSVPGTCRWTGCHCGGSLQFH